MIFRLLYGLFLLSIVPACEPTDPSAARMKVTSILSDQDTQGFAHAVAVRKFNFPRDHGSHPEFKNEWWYITGNLSDPRGQHYGYQLTFFRRGMHSTGYKRDSAWHTQNIWMAHAAVTDINHNEHLSAERFSRGNPGMAGAQWKPFQVWLDDWQLTSSNNEFPWRLKLKTDSFEFDFTLSAEKDIVLQGDRGLSRKSESSGNASYYYSYTRLKTTGQLRIKNNTVKISGLSWLDREWGTSSLDEQQVGWDWFSVQLISGEDLMYFQLRDKAGQSHANSQGIWVKLNGETQRIHASDIKLKPLDWWLSEEGERYPIRWHMQYLPEQKNWIIAARVKNQAMNLTFSYWEGAVAIYDYDSGTQLGTGYLEMTGY